MEYNKQKAKSALIFDKGGKKMRANGISLFIGLTLTMFLCFTIATITPDDPMYRWPGILFIVGFVFLSGLKNVPIQHIEVLKLFGKRNEKIRFEEGWRWIPWFMASTEDQSAKEKDVDVPMIKAFAKDKVEMEIDVWAWYKVENPAIFLNLENPEKTATEAVISNCTEQGIRFIRDNTSNQCLGQEKELQNKIETEVTEEISGYGIKVTSIDVRSILPTQKVRDEFAEDKVKDIKTKRFVKDMKKIKKEASGITDDTLVNTTQVVEKIVEKKIEEKKTTFKLDVEPGVLDAIAEFLPKKKNGGKK